MLKRSMLLAAALAATSANAAFRCTDESGKRHFQDTPPAACANVLIEEVSSSGVVVRRIEPTKAAAAAKDASAERLAAEQKRRDRALMETYASAAEIEIARDRNLDIIKARLEGTRTRQGQLATRETDLKKHLDSYKGKPAPAVQQDLDKVLAEKAEVDASVARIQKDYDQTKAQFDSDKKRWTELKSAQK